MNQHLLPVFFWLMLTAVAAWFFLVARLLRLLQGRYPELYIGLGRPGLLVSRGKPTKRGLLGFLLTRQDQHLHDPALNRLCSGLRVILCLLGVTLAGCLLLLVQSSA